MTMARVYVKFPKTGLGNMLLVWANALIFSQINQLEMTTSSWWGLRTGALLRRERKKRIYHNYFKETSILNTWQFHLQRMIWQVKKNPLIEKLSREERYSKTIFLFDKAITHERLFFNLGQHKEFIKEQLLFLLHPHQLKELGKFKEPVVGVHIRRGDFKLANQITSLSYFITAIQLIRCTVGHNVPVTVFSDARREELEEILDLPEIRIAEDKADILDILLLSKSKILLLSQSSTFSYWAAFLSEALVIVPENDWQVRIKETNEKYAEVRWSHNDAQSTANLEKSVQSLNL